MPSLDHTLDYLYALQHRGIKFGLTNTRRLLRALGDPQETFRSIHVAGTNGKGSTSAYIASILREQGYRTGLYTSPHLLRFTERIRVDGREIPGIRVVRMIRELRPLIEETRATFFEAVTAIAFWWFAERKVEVAVLETGLGGRLDATNVVRPALSVITTIGMDHREHLGETLRSIAREKGGIIKPGVPCVIGDLPPEADETVRRIARRTGSPLIRAADRVVVTERAAGAVTVRARSLVLTSVTPGLRGHYQCANIAVALACCLVMRRGGRMPRVGPRAIRRGLARVVSNTGMRGRFEQLGRTLLDVAHNPDGVRALAENLDRKGIRHLPVVFGVMRDKEYLPMLRTLGRFARPMITVAAGTRRALNERILRQKAGSLGIDVRKGGSVRGALRVARRLAGPRGLVLVTGSHYVVGEALPMVRRGKPPGGA